VPSASIGFRAKTGRAIAVALKREHSAPAYLARWEVMLHDPHVPATGQPHHHVMELPWSDAQSEVRPIEQRIENIAVEVLTGLLAELQSRGFTVHGVGVVGSPDRILEKIGNRHMRAHAAEGILFRRVLEFAAAKHQVRCRSFSDREIGEPTEMANALRTIGRAAGRQWRADERAAAVAACFML